MAFSVGKTLQHMVENHRVRSESNEYQSFIWEASPQENRRFVEIAMLQ